MARPRKSIKANSKGSADISSEALILRAYIDLCYDIGAASITLQKIADRAGVAFGTVRYYFASEKKQIHDEAFKSVLMSSYKSIEDIFFELRKSPKFHPVHAYVEAMFRWASENPADSSFLMYLYYLSSTRVTVAFPVSSTVDRARMRVEGLLHEAIGKKLYPNVRDSAACAAQIHACVVGFGFIAHGFIALGSSGKKKFEDEKSKCLEAVDSIVLRQAV